MTGSVKPPIGPQAKWIASSQALLAMTVDGPSLAALSVQLPLVRSIIRLIDRELVHRGLPQMLRQSRRLQIGLALGDALGERAVEFGERAVHAEQLLQPRGLRGIALLLLRQLPRHQ